MIVYLIIINQFIHQKKRLNLVVKHYKILKVKFDFCFKNVTKLVPIVFALCQKHDH